MYGNNKHTAIHFFASSILDEHRLSSSSSGKLLLPGYVIEQLGDAAKQRTISSHYFHVAHHWLPIVSKQYFCRRLDAPPETWPPDLTLLLLCMKLIDWLPDASGPQTDLYRAVKRFFLEVELTGLVSLTLLQAALLIAFYELGHALYPFASTSVGVCVRYGAALGIEPRSKEPGNRLSTDWVEEEEQTRLWWALFLLDRLVLFHYSVLLLPLPF